MNKRISDTEIENRLKYFIPINDSAIENMLLDLKDARVVVKKYESMMVNKKPSLAEHLQKLANKHKVIFEIIVGERLVFYCDGGSLENNGIIAWTEAEPFFLFDARDFDGDLSGKFIIKPEVTDE